MFTVQTIFVWQLPALSHGLGPLPPSMPAPISTHAHNTWQANSMTSGSGQNRNNEIHSNHSLSAANHQHSNHFSDDSKAQNQTNSGSHHNRWFFSKHSQLDNTQNNQTDSGSNQNSQTSTTDNQKVTTSGLTSINSTTSINSGGINLDLSSGNANTSAANILKGSTIAINVGGSSLTVSGTTSLTAAEKVAVYQAVLHGQQSILLDSTGIADGGSVTIGQHLSQRLGSLEIPTGVTVTDKATSLNLRGDLTDAGSLYLAPKGQDSSSVASIAANNIYVTSGGVLSNIAPVSNLSMASNSSLAGTSPSSNFGIHLSAISNIVNAGTISSGGSLSLTAGNSISNTLPTGTTGGQPVIQAVKNIDIASGLGNITNSGLIASTRGNINVKSIVANNDLNINGSGGTFQALNGNINVRDASYTGNGNLTLNGGNYLSQNFNLYSGTGTITASIGQVSGNFNSQAFAEHISANTQTFKLGNNNVEGDPTYANTGNIEIDGTNNFGANNVAILAGGNITTDSGGNITTSGGNVTLAAGADLTSGSNYGTGGTTIPGSSSPGNPTTGNVSVTLDATGGNYGGNIDFTTSGASTAIQTNGGSVTLIANSTISGGTNGNGNIWFSESTTSVDTSNSGGTGGAVLILAGGTGGTAISGSISQAVQLGPIITAAFGQTGGTVTVAAAPPTIAGGTAVFDVNGNTTATFSAGAGTTNGSIVISNINSSNPGGSVTLTASGSGNLQLLNGNIVGLAGGNTLTVNAGSLTSAGGGFQVHGSGASALTISSTTTSASDILYTYINPTGSGGINIGTSSADGNFQITSNGFNMDVIGNVSAPGFTIFLSNNSATSGGVTDTGGGILTATTVHTGQNCTVAGTSSQPLLTDAQIIMVNALNGSVYVNNNNLTGSATITQSRVSASGTYSLISNGTIIINSAITAGIIILQAGGSTGGITVGSGIGTGTSTSVMLSAPGDITVNANIASGGNINIIAGQNVQNNSTVAAGNTLNVTANSGNIMGTGAFAAPNVNLTAIGGNITQDGTTSGAAVLVNSGGVSGLTLFASATQVSGNGGTINLSDTAAESVTLNNSSNPIRADNSFQLTANQDILASSSGSLAIRSLNILLTSNNGNIEADLAQDPLLISNGGNNIGLLYASAFSGSVYLADTAHEDVFLSTSTTSGVSTAASTFSLSTYGNIFASLNPGTSFTAIQAPSIHLTSSNGNIAADSSFDPLSISNGGSGINLLYASAAGSIYLVDTAQEDVVLSSSFTSGISTAGSTFSLSTYGNIFASLSPVFSAPAIQASTIQLSSSHGGIANDSASPFDALLIAGNGAGISLYVSAPSGSVALAQAFGSEDLILSTADTKGTCTAGANFVLDWVGNIYSADSQLAIQAPNIFLLAGAGNIAANASNVPLSISNGGSGIVLTAVTFSGSIYLTDTAHEDITLASVNQAGFPSQAASVFSLSTYGNIYATDTSLAIQAPSINLASSNGNIAADPSFDPLSISNGGSSLTALHFSAPTGTVNLADTASESVTLANTGSSISAGTITVSTTGNLTVASDVTATSGDLTLQNSVATGNLSINAGDKVIATQGTTFIVVGAIPTPPYIQGTTPTNVIVTTTGNGNAYFGQFPANIIAAGPASVNAFNQNVVFSIGNAAGTINLGGGSLVQAGTFTPPPPPPPPLPPIHINPANASGLLPISSIASNVSNPNSPFLQFLRNLEFISQLHNLQLGRENRLNEQIGTRVATDYTPVLLPQPKNEPLQGGVSISRLADEVGQAMFAGSVFTDQELNALGQQAIVYSPKSGGNFFDLMKGYVLFMPQADIKVQTREGIAYIPKGAAAWIMETGNDAAIYDLHDSLHTGVIKVVANGKEIALTPGRQILLTRNGSADFRALNPGNALGYRHVSATEVGAGIKAYLCDFSIPQAMANVNVIGQLLKSNSPTHLRTAHRMLKNAAIIADLTGDTYETSP